MPTNPASIPVSSVINLYSGAAWQQKFVPTTPAGTAFDCTNYATTPQLVVSPQSSLGNPLTPITPTVVAHDNTGITLSMTAAQVAALLAELETFSAVATRYGFSYGINVADSGGDILLVAQGSGGLQTSPLDF